VVLYKHGVGCFLRREEVEGAGEVHLSFRASEMNDVLKSLTLQDLGGGSVQSVSYDADKPAEKLLAEVALDLPAAGGAAALLGRIRGAAVRLGLGSRSVEGQVVGLDEVQRQTSEGVVRSLRLSLLDGEGVLHSADLAEASEVAFLDEFLRRDLAFYLSTLSHSYRRDKKTLRIRCLGEGRRQVEVGYVIECPVWKTSYRLVLDGDKPFLQGWALVDNTQDEDWVDVRLSLVAGLPISFVHDLYSPRFIQRQEVRVEREAAAAPVMAQAAIREEELPYDPYLDEGRFALAFGPPPPGPAAARGAMREMSAQVVTQSLGDLFEYTVDRPVTVYRNQSALVPILAAEFEGRRVCLYNRDHRPENPFAAVEMRNTTGLTLEGGPATVFEGDTYAGEAMLDTLKPDEKRLVPFAVDLGVAVESDHDFRHEQVNLVRVQGGRLHLHSGRIETRVYRFMVKDDRPRVLWLEHPLREDWRLHDTPAPDETTHSFYRWRLELGPRSTTTFPVSMRTDHCEIVDLRTAGRPQIELYLSRGYFSPEQARRLEDILSLAESQHKLQVKKGETERDVAAIRGDQERLRHNLKALGTTSDEARLRARYVAKLEEQENRLEELQNRSERLQAEIRQRQQELEEALRGLDFEVLLSG
jgi:hypothetical protein